MNELSCKVTVGHKQSESGATHRLQRATRDLAGTKLPEDQVANF